MQLKSHKNYFSSDAGEFTFKLNPGGVFISFHEDSKKTFGIHLSKVELSEKNLTQIKSDAQKYFSDLKKIEMKIIGTSFAIGFAQKSLPEHNFKIVKKVVREDNPEIIFIPSESRVRIAKEVVQSLETPTRDPNAKIKVLIVDDSKTIRTILAKIFTSDPQFEVIGSLELPSQVDPFIEKNRPDVITLDIHMPEMDGVALLKKIYPKHKIPCVMISSISLAEGPMVFDALENGAVDYIQKPEAKDIAELTPTIVEKVKMAANVRSGTRKDAKNVAKVQVKSSKDSLVVIGSSTGGTEALREILTALPDEIPPILIVQHIPPVFSLAFAKRMNELCNFEVIEGQNGDEVKPNRVIVAPGGSQMKMVRRNGKTFVEINDDAPVNRFKPSVDYLFKSVADNIFCHTVAVILTGMGKDGAKEMLNLKNKGVVTIAQNEESCVVFGMPREAIAIGAANYIEHLNNIAERITLATKENSLKKAS